MTIQKTKAEISISSSADFIHQQMESNPHFPFNIQSGWLPAASNPAMRTFLKKVLEAEPSEYEPCIQALDELFSENNVIAFLINNACEQNNNIIEANLFTAKSVNVPRIRSKEDLLNAFNSLLKQPPQFFDNELVGLPFSAIAVGIDPTQSGMTLFRLPMFNQKMSDILKKWHEYLGSEMSNWVFRFEGEQWLSQKAKQQYQFEVWKKDNELPPYWNSWNSFFTRQFKTPQISRPVAAPDDNRIVVSANDGSLLRWDENVAAKTVYWFKDMAYSLSEIISSVIPEQQNVINNNNLLDLFTNGTIFQTYLNPYNFHRWWCPVNGEIVFDPICVPGAYFNKLVVPDFSGATTASLPYLAQINARGLIVFKTDDYGYVCCIPLGMSEVSSVTFHTEMKAGNRVCKGQEMGMFQYGGSSYVIIFQKLPGKRLVFLNGVGDVYEKRPVLPKGSADTGGTVTLIGSQIGKWVDVTFNVDAKQPWQNVGYVNANKSYIIKHIGGLWTANPNINNGNLYGPDGSDIVASQSGYPLMGEKEGALIGRIGKNLPFVVGIGISLPQGQTGHLQLCINDDLDSLYGVGLVDNEGQITVSLTRGTEPTEI